MNIFGSLKWVSKNGEEYASLELSSHFNGWPLAQKMSALLNIQTDLNEEMNLVFDQVYNQVQHLSQKLNYLEEQTNNEE